MKSFKSYRVRVMATGQERQFSTYDELMQFIEKQRELSQDSSMLFRVSELSISETVYVIGV